MAAGSGLLLWLVFFRAGTFVFPFTAGSSGAFFDEAVRIRAGQVMYRDFFEFVGPGAPYLYALALLAFGTQAAVLGWIGVVLGCGLAVAAHALAARLLPSPWTLLPPFALLALVYVPYSFGDHKWLALLFASCALLVLAPGPSPPRAWAAGLLLGASVLCTQDLGLGAAAGALAVLLASGRRRMAASLAVAAAAPPVVALLFFAAHAGWHTMLYDWAVFPLTRYTELNRFGLTARLSLRAAPRDAAQLVLTLAGLAGGVAALGGRGRWGEAPVRPLLAAAGLGAFVATAHRGFYPTGLAVQSSLLVPMGVAFLREARMSPRRGASAAATAALAVVAAGLLHSGPGYAAWRQWLQPLTLEQHRAGAVWVTRPLPELSWVEQQAGPGEGTFLLPARGGHFFLTRARDVTSFPYVIAGQHTPAQAQAVLAQVAAARPAIGIWDESPWPPLAADRPGPLSLLLDGLSRGYDVQRLPSGVLLLRRKEP